MGVVGVEWDRANVRRECGYSGCSVGQWREYVRGEMVGQDVIG